MTKIIIVGGGIIGLSVGWQFLRNKVFNDVVIYEKDESGKAATWTAAGMLAPISELNLEDPHLFELGRKSLLLYPSFLEELTEDAQTNPVLTMSPYKTIIVSSRRDDIDEIKQLYEIYKSLKLSISWITASDIRELEPLISPSVSGGIYIEEDSQIDNRTLAHSLKKAFLNLGGILHENTEIASLYKKENKCLGVILSSNHLDLSDVVLIASGAWSQKIQPAPIRPMKGQLAILDMSGTQTKLSHVIRSPRVYLAPKENNLLKVGATMEDVGFDKNITAGGIMDLLRFAWEVAPSIYECKLAELTCNLRPATTDGLPLVGKDKTLSKLYWATGHYRSGILLAPITAEIIKSLFLTSHKKKYEKERSLLNPSRF